MFGLSTKEQGKTEQWHSLFLDSHQIESREAERLRLQFGALYMSAAMPDGMRLWLTSELRGCATIYISPAAMPYTTDICTKYRAQPCPQPETTNMLLLAGDERGISSFMRGTLLSAKRRQSNLPVPYVYRTLRRFNTHMPAAQMLFVNGQVAPYVKRYVVAWFPTAGASPGLTMRCTRQDRL